MAQEGNYIEYTIIAPETGPLYAYFPKNENRVSKMCVNDQYDIHLYTGETDCVQFLGNYKAGEQIRVKIFGNSLVTNGNAFYQLNLTRFAEAVDALRKESLQLSKWSSGYLKGTAEIEKAGVMFTSLVYDPSWKVLIDGAAAETWAFQDGLLCFDIAAGTHEIEIEYQVPGFVAGMTITVVTITAAVGFFAIRFFRRKR